MNKGEKMLDERGFDLYADEYDASVKSSDEENSYPFAGYREILNSIFQTISQKPSSKVLDIGFGTGTLTAALYENGHEIYGQDFSSKMIEVASAKMPDAHLYQGDFSQGLVEALLQQKYDFIVATYSLHHLSARQKAEFIPQLLRLLKDDGVLMIGDIAFRNRESMESCRRNAKDEWDEEEHYIIADELKELFPDMVFIQKSHCSGIVVLRKADMKQKTQLEGSAEKTARLRECSYSPGYGDMRGEIHSEVLRKDENGKWQIISRDRESLNDPTVITTYAVTEEELACFEAFLEEKDVLLLADRKDSGMFLYDYSPWSYRFIFEKNEAGKIVWDRYQITQYKEYSDSDNQLLDELKRRFMQLHNEKISEEKEKNDGLFRSGFLKG